MRCEGVPSDYIPRNLAVLWPFFEKLDDNGTSTPGEVLRRILAKEQQCWVIVDGDGIRAMALTEIKTGKEKVAEIIHLAGDGMGEWETLAIQTIEAWARELGCVRLKALARPGFARSGRRHGFKTTFVQMEKEL